MPSSIFSLFIKRLLVPALVAVAVSGCSLDYGAALADDLAEDIPDTVVFDFSHTVVENGLPRFRLEADRGESFQAKKTMRLTGIRFTEYAAGGTGISARGRADLAVFHTDTESAELSGAVSFRAEGDGVTVESGYLRWDGEARVLSSRAETVTTLRDDDGTSLTGAGFGADAARRTFSFGNRADGRFVAPEKAE